jgi:cytosine/adenosine deaminase-related metal-dependent hydrolase
MNPQPTAPNPPFLARFDALGAVDAAGLSVSPCSILVEWSRRQGAGFSARVLAVGHPNDVGRHEAARSSVLRVIPRPNAILIPGLVNAHTHLDLTHIGPQPHDPARGFMPWVELIRARRETEPARIAQSVRRGIELSLAGGTVAIGDIAGAPRGQMTLEPWRILRQSPLVGVSWLEFFGIGRGQARSEEMLDRMKPEIEEAAAGGVVGGGVRIGLQPHAPNTVAREVYFKAIAQAVGLGHAASLSTHLAETPEEHEFIARGCGPQRELLESLGLWDDSILNDLGKGLHPVEHLEGVLASRPFTVAHVNDANDATIQILARTRTRVVYCPRAASYFGAPSHFGPHRYREMLAAGICVALGTDSVVNLPPETGGLPAEIPTGRGMSILDEMRFLHARDGTSPNDLLRMGTINGAKSLGLDPGAFVLKAGNPLAGLVAVPVAGQTSVGRDSGDLVRQVVSGSTAPELLFAGIPSVCTGGGKE